MAVVDTESNSDLRQLFQNMSPYFTPEESKNILLSFKKSYGGEFNSLDNSDLLKCFHLLEKHGYVSENNLKLIEDFVALKSKEREPIEDIIKIFKASRPDKADAEKRLEGRNDEVTKINRKLESKDPAALNLFGSSGVGKTKLAKEVCSQWRGICRVFDLREAKDMRAIYNSILHNLELAVPVGYVELKNVVAKVQEKIKELQSNRERHAVLFMLDNVDRFTAGEGKEGKNLKTAFIQFLEKLLTNTDKRSKLKLLLTSRTQLRDSKRVENFEIKPLKRSFSEKILFPAGTIDVQPHQVDKFIHATKGSPLFLEILDPILRQGRKSVDDLIARLTLTPKKSKVEEDASEKPFDFEEDGVDMVQMSVIREAFDTLPTESLKVSAVVTSLFHGPFTVLTAAKVLDTDQSEAIALLEGLVASRIIFIVDEEAKERKYDIHPLLQKYADSITGKENFRAPYLDAKARFYKLFMYRMEEIAKYIEPDYVRAFHLFEKDRGNYEFTVDISLQPEYFSVPGEFHENTLIASLFDAMLNDKQIEVFHSWAEQCEEDGKTGSLTRAQLKCWEAKQVLDVHGIDKALGVLATAFCSLEEVRDKSSSSFKLTKGLYLFSEGEILWRNGDFQKALRSLKSSLEFSESLLKEHTTLARCYNAIGNCYSSLEEEVKALEFYIKAYNMQRKLAGSEHHFDIPMYKNQIGAAYVGQGDYKKATKWYKDALSLLKELKLLGSWDEAQFLRNLANAYIHREKYEKAVEPADRAYATRMKILENHPLTVQSKYQQALIQWYLNEDEKSLQLFLEAWKMEKALDVGNHSPVWQDIIANVETLYDNLRKRNRKKQFRKEALEFCERLWEERKASTLFCFDGFDKGIMDTILQLLGDKKDKYNLYKAEKDQLSMVYSTTREDFQQGSDQTQNLPHRSVPASQDSGGSPVSSSNVELTSEGNKLSDAKSKDKEEEEEEIEVKSSDEDDIEPNPADTEKTLARRGEITDKGDTWNLPEAGAFITFPPGFVEEALWICCSMWSPRSLSPPIGSNELLVSNVIELSHDGPPTLESMEDATGSMTMGLLHSASDFKGYEVVIKKLVDPESNEWCSLETRNVWDTAEMPPAISSWACPYAEANSTITCFSSFAVIWRLKSFTFPKPNSTTPEFICALPDDPNVSIVIPWNSVPDSADFCLTLKIQEPPSIDHKSEKMLVGPILHILCSHEMKLLEPAKIKLPLEFFKGKRELVDSGQWRVFHFQQEWADITDQLEMSVSLTDEIVTLKVKAFCRFWPLMVDNPICVGTEDVSGLYRKSMKQRAGFLACICRHVSERFLLKLYCFPLHWKSKVNEYISCYNVIYQGDGNSKKPLFNEDQTFVSLSEGLEVDDGQNIPEDLSLTFFEDGEDQRDVYVVIKNESNMAVDFLKRLNVEERNDSEQICTVPIIIRRLPLQGLSPSSQSFQRTTLPKKRETIVRSQLDVATTSQVQPVKEYPHLELLKVTLLGGEWNSLHGGLSTFNRELAKHLAKHPAVEVFLFVPEDACTQKDKDDALRNKVKVIEAEKCTGFKPSDWLISPPKDFNTDVVIGHGKTYGPQAQILKRSPLLNCKWVQVVHTSPEELARHKAYSLPGTKPISEGERKREIEVDLCKEAHLVVPVGPKLREKYSSYLASKPDGDIASFTPGLFEEFGDLPDLNKDPNTSSEFKVLLCGRGDPEDFELKGYDIAARAFAGEELRETRCCLYFVGAPDGEHDEKAKQLRSYGIDKRQLNVRKYVGSRAKMKDLLCEVDLVIMPSRTEGFGLIALEALSAGLPILVGDNSGFAQTIKDLPNGESFIVKSEKPEEWATEITNVQKEHGKYIQKIKELREAYGKKYSWEEQCKALVDKMRKIIQGIN